MDMITEEEQVRAIANAVAGYGLRPDPLSSSIQRWLRPRADVFEEPWLMMAAAVNVAEEGEEWRALVEALGEHPGKETLLARVRAGMPPAKFPSLADIAQDLEPIEWLWSDWIPRGMITLLGAVPGAGKSLFALDLARRILGEEGWPDGSRMDAGSGRVVYVDAECVPQLLNERADRWGMDKRRLFLMSPTREQLYIDFCYEDDREHLAEMAYRLSPQLIVIDSLSSISSKGENSVEDVRMLLSYLNGLAQDVQCGLLLIHHLRKGSTALGLEDGIVSIDDFRGSGHIIAMARSVLGMSIVQTGPELDRNGPRRLEVVKTNLGPYAGALGMELVGLGADGVMLRYGKPPKAYQKPTSVDECGDWLLQFLEDAGEPVKPSEVVEAAKEEGWSRSALYRARKGLEGQVVDTRGRNDPHNQWALPGMIEGETDEQGE